MATPPRPGRASDPVAMIHNVHSRLLSCSVQQAGQLLDSLASQNDLLWPHTRWPAMRFDRPLGVEASGGHGPIRYVVESYTPGQSIQFRFTAPRGFLGGHALSIRPVGDNQCQLTHVLTMDTTWSAWFQWQLVYRPLHDALLEDALDKAGSHFGQPASNHWSVYVRLLRALLTAIRKPRPRGQ